MFNSEPSMQSFWIMMNDMSGLQVARKIRN